MDLPKSMPAKRSKLLWLSLFSIMLISFFLLAAGVWATLNGYLSDAHAGFLAKAYLAVDRGRLETVGFSYPPLPLLLLLPKATVFTPVVWGSLFIATLIYFVISDLYAEKKQMFAVVLLALAASPAIWRLSVDDFSQALGVLLIWLAWRFYKRWIEEDYVVYGFYSGIFLGLAVYATPVALPVALLLAAGIGLLKKQTLSAWAAGALVLTFPILVGILIWAYLAWLFTGSWAFLYQIFYYSGLPLRLLLFSSGPYLVALVSLAWRRDRKLIFYALAGLIFPLLALRGFGYSYAMAVVLLDMLALAALSTEIFLWERLLLTLAALLQIVVLWSAVPWKPQPTEGMLMERAIGQALAQAAPRSILTDDSFAYPYIAWSGSAKPYLLPADAGYYMALVQPSTHADYVFVCAGGTRIAQLYGESPPPGFFEDWRYKKCRFYRKPGAPPLVSTTARF
ncbi:hypothetical protein [Oceanithermus sp.]